MFTIANIDFLQIVILISIITTDRIINPDDIYHILFCKCLALYGDLVDAKINFL